jgi:hypothetical protein
MPLAQQMTPHCCRPVAHRLTTVSRAATAQTTASGSRNGPSRHFCVLERTVRLPTARIILCGALRNSQAVVSVAGRLLTLACRPGILRDASNGQLDLRLG